MAQIIGKSWEIHGTSPTAHGKSIFASHGDWTQEHSLHHAITLRPQVPATAIQLGNGRVFFFFCGYSYILYIHIKSYDISYFIYNHSQFCLSDFFGSFGMSCQEDPQFNYLPLWLISKKAGEVLVPHLMTKSHDMITKR